jgi:hypothetical protein
VELDFKRAAQTRKALRLVNSCIQRGVLTPRLEGTSDEGLRALEAHAGLGECSEETWGIAFALLEALENSGQIKVTVG